MLIEVYMFAAELDLLSYLPVKKSDFTHFPDFRTVVNYCKNRFFFFNVSANVLTLQPELKLMVIVVDHH